MERRRKRVAIDSGLGRPKSMSYVIGHNAELTAIQTLTGLYPSKVDSLALVIRYPDELGPDDTPSCSDLRLFSSGGGSELIEWDMDHSCIKVALPLHPKTYCSNGKVENNKFTRRRHLVHLCKSSIKYSSNRLRGWLRSFNFCCSRHSTTLSSFRPSQVPCT